MRDNQPKEALELSDSELIEVIKNHGTGRRSLMKALGMGAALTVGAGSASAGHGGPHGNPKIDPYFGYSSHEDQDLSETDLEVNRTVELHIDRPPIPFHFDPMGIHVDVDDTVRFDIKAPDHTITAFHLGHGRQQRVPDDAKAFSSPIIIPGGFWLYEFNHPGIYDIYCAPHEFFAMVMRIVVGDPTSDDFDDEFSDSGRPPITAEELEGLPGVDEWVLPTSADVFATNAMSVSNIVDNGPVTRFDVADDL